MTVTVTVLIQKSIISWNCNCINFRKIRKSVFSGFPENPEVRISRISRTSGNPGFPDFREIRKSGFSRFPGNPEIQVLRISGFPKIRKARFPESQIKGFLKIPGITVTALINWGIISGAVIHYSYSINCFWH